jgi:dihydroorotate dehydrogenase
VIYQQIFKHVFSKMDPEKAHHLVHTGITVVGRTPILAGVIEGAFAPYLTRGEGVRVFGRRVPQGREGRAWLEHAGFRFC